MSRATILAVAVTAVILTTLWSFQFLNPPTSTRTHLPLPAPVPQPPQRLTEGCSEVQQAQALSSPSSESRPQRPAKSATPFTADEEAIYRAVLERWLSHERMPLNVSATTFPLKATSAGIGFLNCECMKGIYLEPLPSPFHSFHTLTTDVLPEDNIRLVDAQKQAAVVRANDPGNTIGKGKSVNEAVRNAMASGLFSMSEIAFDREHQYAVVSYAFWCGSLCGSGATLVLEKIGGSWKIADRQCGGWVS